MFGVPLQETASRTNKLTQVSGTRKPGAPAACSDIIPHNFQVLRLGARREPLRRGSKACMHYATGVPLWFEGSDLTSFTVKLARLAPSWPVFEDHHPYVTSTLSCLRCPNPLRPSPHVMFLIKSDSCCLSHTLQNQPAKTILERWDEHGRFDHRVAFRIRFNVILHTLPINVKQAEPLTGGQPRWRSLFAHPEWNLGTPLCNASPRCRRRHEAIRLSRKRDVTLESSYVSSLILQLMPQSCSPRPCFNSPAISVVNHDLLPFSDFCGHMPGRARARTHCGQRHGRQQLDIQHTHVHGALALGTSGLF